MFPRVEFTLTDGRSLSVQPILGDVIRAETTSGRDASTMTMNELGSRLAFHAARRSLQDIPDTFDGFLDLLASMTLQEDGEGKVGGEPALTGG